MNRQSINKAQKSNDPAALVASGLLQRKKVNQTDIGSSMAETQKPAGFVAADTTFNHDLSTIPVSPKRQSLPIQAKLKIGQPNDKYEQEADRVAEQVMRMPNPQAASSNNIGLTNHNETIQRACASCSAEYKTAEEESRAVPPANLCPKCRNKGQGIIQRKPSTPIIQATTSTIVTPDVSPEINAGIQLLQGGGQPLSASERGFFEPRFGADFSAVRVHNNAQAAGVAQSINARAYTHGHHVVFGAGEYASDSISGKRLLAHELTHVVQQQSTAPLLNTFLQLQQVDNTWRAPTSGVVQAWVYNQIDNWHTGAIQALSFFKGRVLTESSVGFWLQLAGNVLWAGGAMLSPAGAVATGMVGVAIATIGARVQERQGQEEYQRVQDIYEDLLFGMNRSRSLMDAMVIAETDRVMMLGSYQNAVVQQDTAAWQQVVRNETQVPEGEGINAVSQNVEQNLYIRYLSERGAWVSNDVFSVPSRHHPGLTTENRNFFPHRIPERVQDRLTNIGIDWRRINELPIPHRHRNMYRTEGTVGAIEYWNYDEETNFPPSWTDMERREFLMRVPSYLGNRQTGITH